MGKRTVAEKVQGVCRLAFGLGHLLSETDAHKRERSQQNKLH